MARRAVSKPPSATLPAPPAGSAIRICADGAYRWTYAFPLFTNPSILLWGWKIVFTIIGLTLAGIWIVFAAITLVQSGLDAEAQLFNLRLWLGAFALFLALWPLGYLLLALLCGGKYWMDFRMDAAGIAHAQTPRQFRKSRGLGAAAGLLGALSGSIGAVQAGRLLGARGRMSMNFADVRSARASRRWSIIFLNEESVYRHLVYVEPQDFDFMLGVIRSLLPAKAAARLQA